LAWAFIVYSYINLSLAGKRRYAYLSGVPLTYRKGFDIFHPDMRRTVKTINQYPRSKFIRGLIAYSIITGSIGAYLVTDNEFYKDRLTTRPDLLPMRIMTNNVPLREQKVFEFMHGNYFGTPFEEQNTSIWKRFLHYWYPYHNYKPSLAYYLPFYDYKKDYHQADFDNHYHFKDC
jgi:hypothetical protein